MNHNEINTSFSWNERISSVFNHLLVGLMMFCFALVVSQFIKRLFPLTGLEYLPLICLIVAMDAQYTKRFINKYTLFSKEWAFFRIGEFIILIVGLRIFVYLISGKLNLASDIKFWDINFYDSFFSPDFIPFLIVVLLVWVVSGSLAENLFKLEGDLLRMNKDVPPGLGEERYIARKQLMDHILLFGIVLVILTGFVRIDIRGLEGESPPVTSVIGVVLYFIFGLILLSLTQFSILRGRWSSSRIPIAMKIGSRWIIYSFLFLSILMAVSILLPTNYSLGFLTSFGYILLLILDLVTKLFGFLILLLLWFFSRFGTQEEVPSQLQPPPILPDFTPVPGTDGISPWWDIIKSTIFWLVFLSIIGLAAYQYLLQHKGIADRIRKIPGILWFSRLAHWLIGFFNNVGTTITAAIESGKNKISPLTRSNRIPDQLRFFKKGSLTPRERIIFFYLVLTRRGKESGIERKKSQSPYEYSDVLKSQIPELEEEVSSMTDTFVEARYSQHYLAEEHAKFVRHLWGQIRKALSKKRS
jgi:hypothetical protein